MAGDWIKMRVGLGDEPEVIRLATICRLDEDAVVGKLHRFWSWLDQHTTDGFARGATPGWLDRMVNCKGFAEGLATVGWLAITDAGLAAPGFDRHNGETGKQRSQGALRAKRYRDRRASASRAGAGARDEELKGEDHVGGHADSVTGDVTECVTTGVTGGVTKRREEKRVPPLPSEDAPGGGGSTKRFRAPTLDEVEAYCTERQNDVDARKFMAHYESNGWMVGRNRMKDWRAAVRTWERSSIHGPGQGKGKGSREATDWDEVLAERERRM